MLAPLERSRQLELAVLDDFDLRSLELRNLAAVRPVSNAKGFEEALSFVPALVLLYLVIGGFVRSPGYWVAAGAGLGAVIVVVLLITARGVNGAWQTARQFLSLLLSTLTAVAIPAGIIYLFGGGRGIFTGPYDLLVLGRVLQFLFITSAALLPALLYYLFDRHQLATLRDRFEQQIFRFDPDVRTLADVRSRYGRQLEEAFGHAEAADGSRLSRAKQWPILVATLVITLGWILALAPVHAPGAAPTASEPAALLQFFLPQNEPMVWGFLGAYFFALHTVLHRYVRRDLKPSAYASVTVRVLVVLILSWVLVEVLPSRIGRLDVAVPISAILFLIGVLPESGVALLQHATRSVLGLVAPETYREEHPLTRLEGIGLYDRARLEDEGVTNVQSLAHHDLIDLIVETRIPVPRIVDWVDQAILYLHLSRVATAEPAGAEWGRRFAALGIRSATDLLRVYGGAVRSEPPPDYGLAALAGADADPHRLEQLHALVTALQDDEWLQNIRYWRAPRSVEEQELVVPAPEPSERPSGRPAGPLSVESHTESDAVLTGPVAGAEEPSTPRSPGEGSVPAMRTYPADG